MRYWAAGFLLTVLLFGGGSAGRREGHRGRRPVPDADPGQTGTVPDKAPPTGRFCCGCGTGSRWWR
ncbi:MAG: hypothetical protein ACLU38_05250 [Dysosmobacter sp.]